MSSALRRPVASEYPLIGGQSERICRGCGCTDSHACPGGCSWVLLDIDTPSGICSSCAIAVEWDPIELAYIGTGADIHEE